MASEKENGGMDVHTGFKNSGVANSHSVGPQAAGDGANLVKGQDVAYTHNPKGIVPKKMAGGGVQIVQGPIEPKVGK